MKRKNVVFICNNFPNVSETFIRSQIDHFIEETLNVKIFAAGKVLNNELLRSYPMVVGMHSYIMKLLYFPFYFLKLVFVNPKAVLDSLNVLKYGKEALYLKLFYALLYFYNSKCDVLICHFGRSGNVGAFLKKHLFPRAKLLCMFHGRDIREGIPNEGKIYEALFSEADYILSISDYNDKYLSMWRAPNIVRHPVGIDTQFFKKGEVQRSKSKEVRLLTVGRLVEEKGYIYALEALLLLRGQEKDMNLIYDIVGEGEKRKEIEAFIDRNNLKSSVNLHGAKGKEDILRFYQQSDIFLLPSVAEALPVVIMEALSCELPVVATNVGSVREEVYEGENGFVVETRNPVQIAEKVKILVKDPGLRSKMGSKGRSIIRGKYDIRKLNKRLVELVT